MKKAALAIAALACLLPVAAAATQTVCTITVNSPDEKETMRKRLPPGRYDFVELVQKGREDWLRNSCRKNVQCDVLVISGHFNAGDTFYSDRIDNADHLAIDELERAACSDCPGLFARLKEVYLFGCESLNPDASKYASAYGESGRERMRRIFSNVPSIYGFSGPAPVGPTAAMLLNKYFDGGSGSFGAGSLNARLLSAFSRNSMVRVAGAGSAEAGQRERICRFFDERTTHAAKLRFVHGLMKAEPAGPHLKRIERLLAAMSPAERQDPAFAEALAQLSADDETRGRFLAAARQSQPAPRARMIELATNFGWLSPDQKAAETLALAGDVLASRNVGFAEVDLVCSLNADHTLDGGAGKLRTAGGATTRVGHAAVLACLGDGAAHQRTLGALLSAEEDEARIAQAYLRHRPVRDVAELRPVARAVAQMPGSTAKVRALDALARLRISDREILAELTHSFAQARSANVQNAIAEIFLRSDYRAPDLAEVLQKHRLTPPARGSVIDSLLSRLEAG